MCNGNCGCNNSKKQESDHEAEVRYAHDNGVARGFSLARRVFWSELMSKAGDMGAMASRLNGNGDDVNADIMKVAEAAYFNAAEALLRDRRDYPGYIEKDEDAEIVWDEDTWDNEGPSREENNSDSCERP